MEPTPTTVAASTEDEWELADEELDRTKPSGFSCSTSRPCTCQLCSSSSRCG